MPTDASSHSPDRTVPTSPTLIEIVLERAGKSAWRVEEIATLFSCHPDWLYRRIKKGTIPYFQLGSQYRFDPVLLAKWMEGKSV